MRRREFLKGSAAMVMAATVLPKVAPQVAIDFGEGDFTGVVEYWNGKVTRWVFENNPAPLTVYYHKWMKSRLDEWGCVDNPSIQYLELQQIPVS